MIIPAGTSTGNDAPPFAPEGPVGNELAPSALCLTMNFFLKVWRQGECEDERKTGQLRGEGHFTKHLIPRDARHRERATLTVRGEEPIAFDSDCREGICGTCSMTINGEAHGPNHPGAVCELYMRSFRNGETILVEPFRARAFPIIKDLVIDRSALDRVVQAGGFISARTGSAPEANSILVPKKNSELAMEAAACIGCGACVAAVSERFRDVIYRRQGFSSRLPAPRRTGTPSSRPRHGSRDGRGEGFGNCTNIYECVAVCPADISGSVMAKMYREYAVASWVEAAGE